MSVEMWLPMLGNGGDGEANMYHPDLPPDVRYDSADVGMEFDLSIAPPRPLTSLYGAIIADKDSPAVRDYLAAQGRLPQTVDDLPEPERYAARMIRECSRDWSGSLRAYIASLPDARAVAKALLPHAIHRDIRSLRISEDILASLGIPPDSTTAGIDSALFAAGVIYYIYNVKTEYLDNDGYLAQRLVTPAEATTMLAADLSTGALSRP